MAGGLRYSFLTLSSQLKPKQPVDEESIPLDLKSQAEDRVAGLGWKEQPQQEWVDQRSHTWGSHLLGQSTKRNVFEIQRKLPHTSLHNEPRGTHDSQYKTFQLSEFAKVIHRALTMCWGRCFKGDFAYQHCGLNFKGLIQGKRENFLLLNHLFVFVRVIQF